MLGSGWRVQGSGGGSTGSMGSEGSTGFPSCVDSVFSCIQLKKSAAFFILRRTIPVEPLEPAEPFEPVVLGS